MTGKKKIVIYNAKKQPVKKVNIGDIIVVKPGENLDIIAKQYNLIKLGINKHEAWIYANTRKSYWRIANSPFLKKSLTNKTLVKLGYTSLSSVYC